MYLTNYELNDFKIEVYDTLKYYHSSNVNSHGYKEISDHARKHIHNQPNQELELYLIDKGFFTPLQCFSFISTHYPQSPLSTNIIGKVINLMERHGIIEPFNSVVEQITNDTSKRYGISRYGIELSKWGIILLTNKILGFANIFGRYSDSIFKIANEDQNGDIALGTGFCVTTHLKKNGAEQRFLITNKHVVEKFDKLSVFTKNDQLIEYDNIKYDEKRDIAFIELKDVVTNPPYLILKPKIDILSDIITIGYPGVPFLKESYQLSHKGEVNSLVEDFYSNKFFLISAKTSSGNSGSPVINDEGCVVGMLTQELYDKNDFIEKGKPPYYAAIPSIEIINSFNELINKENAYHLQIF